MISILDYGVGNLASITNAFAFLGIPSRVISSPSELASAGHLLIPGVGAFGHGMNMIRSSGFADPIREAAVHRQRPILGICLGMQLLMDRSSEGGEHEGLGIVRGEVRNLSDEVGDLVVPHVGWNDVEVAPRSKLIGMFGSACTMYFVHGYYCRVSDPSEVTGRSRYGVEMDVIVESGNVFGCQFHPEKSQQRGLELLRNFAAA